MLEAIETTKQQVSPEALEIEIADTKEEIRNRMLEENHEDMDMDHDMPQQMEDEVEEIKQTPE